MDTSVSTNQLLRINDVSQLTSLAKSTINLWVTQGKFPKPISLSPTIKVWRTEQIESWINQLADTAQAPSDSSGA